MTSPKFITFHNPLRHPTYDKEGVQNGTVEAKPLTFRVQTHESGMFDEYKIDPGEEFQVPEKHAFAVKSLAPQVVEGPFKAEKAKDAEKPAAKTEGKKKGDEPAT